METTIADKRMIDQARSLVGEKEVKGGVIREVGSVLLTESGEIFIGASINLACGIGFCAEHTAISQMLTISEETHIQSIVACDEENVLLPCGRCRELMNLIDERNRDTEVIVSMDKKVYLKELLPNIDQL